VARSLIRLRPLGALALTAGLTVALAACGGSSSDKSKNVSSVKALPSSSCTKVQYGGSGQPDVLIASDLPMQGAAGERSRQMVDAIQLVLEQANWKAGSKKVAFQACDDSIKKTGAWDEAKCRSNANAYAGNPDVVGVIGTYNSGCAAEIIPILNKAKPEPVGMVSPGNTLICLTEQSNTCEKGQPGSYYPSGSQNYIRVVPNDAFQGAALAGFAKKQGATKVFIFYAADDPTSLGQAQTFRNAAKDAGVTVVGFKTWDPKAKDYRGLMKQVDNVQGNGVLLAGLTEQNGGQIIKDKVAELGPNDGKVKLFAPDGFTQQSTIDKAGPASAGMFASIPGRDPSSLSGPGKQLVADLKQKVGGKPVELYAPYAGQSAQVLLDAISASGGQRKGTINALFKTSVKNGILGTFTIVKSGDPSVGPVTVFKASKSFVPFTQITPPSSLVTAARG
jgi:branched-chain amino acid transport system substrate-binding protein